MKIVYIVSAFQGEYFHRLEWNIKAFSSETSAQKFLISLEEKERLEIEKGMIKEFYSSYYDINYKLEAIELVED